MNSKITTIKSFLKKKNIKNKNNFSRGVFDLVHIGHIDYLNAASKLGEILVVSLTDDKCVNKGPFRPILIQIKERIFI